MSCKAVMSSLSGGATLLLWVTLLSQGRAATAQSGALHVFIFFMPDLLLGINHFSVVWPTEKNQRSSFFPRAGWVLTLILLLQIPVWFIWQAALLNVPRTEKLEIQEVPSKKILLLCSLVYSQEINGTHFWEENQCYSHLPSLVKKAALFSAVQASAICPHRLSLKHSISL